ncbi:MAG TPA: DUF6152 family protein [Vicinamibacterales bacterium]|nr:DUF6152 family protein [Vicinamibacterales bacterium]
MRNHLAGIALLVAASVAPALAHHPFAAEYDWKKPVTITGSVTKFDWGNPHAMLTVKGRDEKGTEAEWTIELGSPGRLTVLGWNDRQLKSGDRVIVDGWLAKSAKKQVSGKSVTTPAGRELAAASSFFEEARASASAHGGTREAKATTR